MKDSVTKGLYIILFTLIILLLPQTTAADPWGSDSSLAEKVDAPSPSTKDALSTPQKTLKAIIKFHQEIISPVDGPRSHFIPSSSQYMWSAITEYGALYGWILGCDRLLRENGDPWVYPVIPQGDDVVIKYDPVPPRR